MSDADSGQNMRIEETLGVTGTNLQYLNSSRKRQKPGDVFAMKLPNDAHLYGRVVSVTAEVGPMKNVLLLYVYRGQTIEKAMPPLEAMKPSELLLPPLLTNRKGWTLGLFETVGHAPLEADDLLESHCFYSLLRGVYFDEKSTRLAGPAEPVGRWGLESYRTIDDQISDCLGYQRVP